MGKKIFVVEEDKKIKIEKFLKKLGFSYSAAAQLIRKGNVKINGKRQKSSYLLQPGDVVELFMAIQPKTGKDIIFTKKHEEIAEQLIRDIIYKDENILILNKPAGIPVQGGNKVKISIDDLSNYLKFNLPNKPKLVHRLDRDTSGILVMARNDRAAKALSTMFKESGTIKKYYLALCNRVPYKQGGTISIPIAKVKFDKEIMCYSPDNGDEAISYYQVVTHNEKLSLIQFQIVTGRTHQIRVHAATSGIPIVGDYKYNDQYFEMVRSMMTPHERQKFILNSKSINPHQHEKLCLHSEMIEFILFDNQISVKAPLPRDFQLLLDEVFD